MNRRIFAIFALLTFFSSTVWAIIAGAQSPTIPVSTMFGDYYGDCLINSIDFAMLMEKFGSSDPAYDLNGNGTVDTEDLNTHLLLYETVCSIET
ncbi:hypothetical protein HY469_00855 [Candidatus Roizmanbacteria bacterium]|nr:hypothetical protein [Candidatus Roizmanbacteria bacterium]